MSLKILPTGDANFWRLMDGDRWIAVIQFNGELMEARQIEMGRQFCAAENMLNALQTIGLHVPSLDQDGIRELVDGATAFTKGAA